MIRPGILFTYILKVTIDPTLFILADHYPKSRTLHACHDNVRTKTDFPCEREYMPFQLKHFALNFIFQINPCADASLQASVLERGREEMFNECEGHTNDTSSPARKVIASFTRHTAENASQLLPSPSTEFLPPL